PTAVVAGYQFPILIALVGRGGKSVARHTGLVYAWNTAGAIAGSLAGGFGLLRLLTAPGTWRLVGFVLFALAWNALALAWLGRSNETARRPVRLWITQGGAVLLSVFAGGMLLATGPTAVWRHSPIGAGRVRVQNEPNINVLNDFAKQRRRAVLWE